MESSKPAIELTEKAAQHVRGMLARRGEGLGLRLSTCVSGCTGYAYVVDYADEVAKNDSVIESKGVNIIVDDKSLKMLEGTKVDYVQQNLLNYGFEFNNPNVEEACGCGESFSLKSQPEVEQES